MLVCVVDSCVQTGAPLGILIDVPAGVQAMSGHVPVARGVPAAVAKSQSRPGDNSELEVVPCPSV